MTRGVGTRDNDFLALVDEAPELAKEAGTLRFPMLREEIRCFSERVRRHEYLIDVSEYVKQDVVISCRILPQPSVSGDYVSAGFAYDKQQKEV